jgi:hypothetical protein
VDSTEGDLAGKYLFLLRGTHVEALSEGVRYLRELGIWVLHRQGNSAVVGLANHSQIEAAGAIGLFAMITRQRVQRAVLEQLPLTHQQAVRAWNGLVSAEYRKLRSDKVTLGKSWASKGLGAPGPSTWHNTADIKVALLRSLGLDETEMGRRQRDIARRRLPADEVVTLEQLLRRRLGNETAAYHLARVLAQLGPAYVDLAQNLSQEFVDEFLATDDATCWTMAGEIAVGVVFVESSKSGGPKFSNSVRSLLQSSILDGLDWLSAKAPLPARLTWVYDWQFTSINVENGDNDDEEDYWRDPAMGQVSFNGASFSADWGGMGAYREALHQHYRSAHAIVIFVTPYANHWHAYAGGGRVTLADRNDWEGWGIGGVDNIVSHEVCHLFGAPDEYADGGGDSTPCSSCGGTFGCLNIPNGNCEACAHPHQDCIMSANSRRLCAYTQGHLGWADLFVELTTGDIAWAGTDDDVWLDLGDRSFRLDTLNHDDRERGNVEGYAFNYTGVTAAQIKRVGIRKSPDGSNGGWRLQRVRLWHRGQVISDVPSINAWLEDNRRWWVSPISGSGGDLVNSLRVEVTTGDIANGGTNDEVRLTLGGRSWILDNPGQDDFERGATNTFELDPGVGLYASTIGTIRIHKSPDGSYGGWRLGGVRILVNGQELYDNHQINKWLEDDDRDWIGGV